MAKAKGDPCLVKLAAARVIALRKAPYFATALFSLQPKRVPDEQLMSGGQATMAVTNRGVLLWTEGSVNRQTPETLASDLIHEVNHWIRDHAGRAKKHEIPPDQHAEWNYACDAEINDDLAPLKLDMSAGGWIMPSHYNMPDGLTAEAYYASRQQAQNKPKPGVGAGACGSCAGHATDGEPPDQGDASPGHSDAVRIKVQQITAQAVQQAAERGPAGSVPAGLARWAGSLLAPPQVPWRAKLARVVRGVVTATGARATDSSYARPHRRQAGLGFGGGVPVLTRPVYRVPNVLVAIDTSGSMGDEELRTAASELSGVLSAVRGVTFMACDCAVHEQKKVTTMSEALALFTGGGGTSFYPIFSAVAEMKSKPNVVIVLTDGGGSAPASAPPGVTVIWVLVGRYQCKPDFAGGQPFGEFIEVTA